MWMQLLVSLVLSIISAALRPKPPQPAPPAIGDINAPTAEEGRPVPVIFGTAYVKDTNVIWYGDMRTTPIKTKGGKK